MSEFENFPTPAHFSIATYARLLLPELMDVDSALYLDSDVLVQADPGLLMDAGRESGAALAAVRDFGCPTFETALPDEVARTASGSVPYFNAGVLVMDLARWRRERLGEEIAAWLRDHPEEARFVDQDGINVVLANQIHELDPAWNVQTGPLHTLLRNPHDIRREHVQHSPEGLLRDARIVHFVHGKPWRGDGLQANRLSMRATTKWWQVARTTGIVPGHELARQATAAVRVAVPYSARNLARGRTRSVIMARARG